MIKSVVTAIGAAVLASACATPYSETPLATNFATSKQHKLQAASHWSLISRDVAARLSASLPKDAPVFVNQASEQTAFERAFTTQLLTALVQAGHPVMKSPEGALRIGVDTQSEFASGETPQHEIIITTTVSDANRYIARDSSVYYVADGDLTLYIPPAASHAIVKTFAVAGDE